MKIQSIQAKMTANVVEKKENSANKTHADNKRELIMKSLDSMANINAISFSGKKNKEKFEIGLSTEELQKRTNKDCLIEKKLLTVNSLEYKNLAEGDKQALKHLVKAAKIMDEVYLKQDNEKNIPFREILKEKAAKGDEDAKMALVLFTAQKGINGSDSEANKIRLLKGAPLLLGKGVYPADITKEEFQDTLIEMLKNGKKEQVKNVLNQRSVVRRTPSGELKSTDYTKEYKQEFHAIAKELEKAAKVSTNKDFNEYLMLQSKALKDGDPMLDAYADKKWAELQDTPLEFTITRENYEDELMGCVFENQELTRLLNKNHITPTAKDMLGFRVGIVNKAGTEQILKVKEFLPIMAENMPLKEQYEQTLSASSKDEIKQTMVDVDLVSMAGNVGEYRGGITIAENLPNDDKLSMTIGGGRRNVYHRQIRQVSDLKKVKEKADAILDPSLHKYYEPEADHWFTIGHENGHSLGPKKGTEPLGKYKNIIEENKADMVAIAMVDVLTEKGMYTEKQKKQILTTFVVKNMLKAEPDLTKAHRVRSVMETSFFLKEKAINIDDGGILHIDLEKMVPTAQKMLKEIVKVQISGDFNVGEKFVKDNFVWTDGMEKVAENIRKIDKSLNGILVSQLEEKLANED